MDALDALYPSAADLCGHVDALLLRNGAPAGHPVWPLLRQVGALPSSAVAWVAGLRPEPHREAAAGFSAVAEECRDIVVSVPRLSASAGAVAEVADHAWSSIVAATSSADGDALDVRLEASGRCRSEFASWIEGARQDLAAVLGRCIGSAEAVAVRTTPDDPGTVAGVAAADIAARVLRCVAASAGEGWEVRARWAGLGAEIPVRVPSMAEPLTTDRIEIR